jgi:RNA polymerase sigma factor (sigma-70 family)
MRHVSRSYYAPGLTFDDFMQEARLGLLDAHRRYDPTKGAFHKLARVAIECACQTAMKKAIRQKHQYLNTAEGEPSKEISDSRLSDPVIVVIAKTELDRLIWLINSNFLTETERTVLLAAANGLSREVSEVMVGLPTRDYTRVLSRTRKKLKEAVAA